MKLQLQAQTRKAKGKQLAKFRKAGTVPAVLYGHGMKSVSLAVAYSPFEKVYREAGGSSLIDIEVDNGKPVKALIQDVQRDPLSGKFLHVDFHAVRMTEKINTEVVLKFTGESKAVKELGGILVKNLDEVKVSCLPSDLVHEIEIDISRLTTFEDQIRIRDLRVPTGIEIKEKPEEVVVLVQPPRTEEELKELEQTVVEDVQQVEKVEKEKKEEEAEETAEEVPKQEEKKDAKASGAK